MTAPTVAPEQYTSSFTRSSTTTDAESIALITSYIAATATLRARVKYMTDAWFGADGYRTPGAEMFINMMVPVLDASQQVMANLTSAYLVQQIVTLGGGTTAAAGISPDLVTGSAIRGVDPVEVLRRPYEQMWTALSRGKSFDDAVQVGRVRAESISMTNLQLAKVKASQEVLSKDHRVVGYRRVLTNPKACGLCILASSQRYHKADLLPLHPSCDCAIAPIVGTQDPGRIINSAMLVHDAISTDNNTVGTPVYRHDDTIELGDLASQAHDAIKQRFGQSAADGRSIDYRKMLITIDHGEYGPTLTVAPRI